MRWIVMLVVGLGGCSTPNPAYDPPGAEGGTAATTDATTDFVSTTAAASADSITTAASTVADGTSTDEGDPGDSSTDPTLDTTGSEPDGCPGGGPLDPFDLAGGWWTCEHGINGLPPSDGCTMLDDDGLRLQPNGELVRVYWGTAPEENCQGNPGRCFACNLPDAGRFTATPWGQWTAVSMPGGAVEISVSQDNPGCEGTLTWSPVAGQPYVRVDNSFEEACFLIEGEPNIPSGGPWFMRLLDPL